MPQWSSGITTFLRKPCLLDSWRSYHSTKVVTHHDVCCYTTTACYHTKFFTHPDICCYTTHIPKNTILRYDFLPCITHSKHIGHPCLEAHFPLPYPSHLHAFLPFWVSYIPLSFFLVHFWLIFPFPFALRIKPLSFLSMITLPCFPCPADPHCLTMSSFHL